MTKRSICQTSQSTAFVHSHPKTPVTRDAEGIHHPAFQFRRVPGVVNDETYTIKTSQSFMGADPKIAIGSLGYGVNHVMRQTIIGLPGARDELRRMSRAQDKRENLAKKESNLPE